MSLRFVLYEAAVFVKNNIDLFEYRKRLRHQDKLPGLKVYLFTVLEHILSGFPYI